MGIYPMMNNWGIVENIIVAVVIVIINRIWLCWYLRTSRILRQVRDLDEQVTRLLETKKNEMERREEWRKLAASAQSQPQSNGKEKP